LNTNWLDTMSHHKDRGQSPTGTWDCTESRTVSNKTYIKCSHCHPYPPLQSLHYLHGWWNFSPVGIQKLSTSVLE
jgi:Pyruvate/2-oxoacid:ferredoxin oxidoreductase delta subunit